MKLETYISMILTNITRFEEILQGIEEEAREKSGVTIKELLLPTNRHRIFLIIALQVGTSTHEVPMSIYHYLQK